MGSAAASNSQEELRSHLRTAELDLNLLRTMNENLKPFSKANSLLGVKDYQSVLDHIFKWAHFTIPAEYIEVRQSERALLVNIAENNPWLASDCLENLKIWDPFETGVFSAEKRNLKQEVFNAFTPSIIKEIHNRFSRQDGIRSLWPIGKHSAEKYILLRRESEFYAPAEIDKLREVASRSKEDQIVQDNFIEYIQLIEQGLKNKLQILGRKDVITLAADTEIISFVWKAVVAKPLQIRTMGGLKDTRNTLIDVVKNDDHVSLPPWWTA